MRISHNGKLPAEALTELKSWFHLYVRSFYSNDPIVQGALVLKEDHSLRVCNEILNIGKRLDMEENDLRIAEAAALFHDIGRFEQYTRYRTFVDKKSANHGMLGVKVLRQHETLRALDQTTQDLIVAAVSYHNRLSIPEDENPACLFFSRLLRDADKLDIFAIVSAYYAAHPVEKSAALELDLPDGPEVSEEILDSVEQGKMITMRQLRTLNDFKLMQMAWIYDINFPPTFQMVAERNYLQKIRDTLPASERIDRLYARLIARDGT
jgi:putative nucleotidyltransferase with HDIG domain